MCDWVRERLIQRASGLQFAAVHLSVQLLPLLSWWCRCCCRPGYVGCRSLQQCWNQALVEQNPPSQYVFAVSRFSHRNVSIHIKADLTSTIIKYVFDKPKCIMGTSRILHVFAEVVRVPLTFRPFQQVDLQNRLGRGLSSSNQQPHHWPCLF